MNVDRPGDVQDIDLHVQPLIPLGICWAHLIYMLMRSSILPSGSLRGKTISSQYLSALLQHGIGHHVNHHQLDYQSHDHLQEILVLELLDHFLLHLLSTVVSVIPD